MSTTIIDYAMTKDYRKEWGVVDAIREIVQNCLDNRDNVSVYDIDDAGSVIIDTFGYTLPKSALALGNSLKPDAAIGGFGEGFKLAMMVLTRAGCNPVAVSGDSILRPAFVYNAALGVETFCIQIEPSNRHYDGLQYAFDIDVDIIDEVREKINVFSDNQFEAPEAGDVVIMEDHPGQVFVCGLYVCNEENFKFGYNFAADMIELGCDRQIASSFGMAWETSRVWASKVDEYNAAMILDMINNQVLDVADIHHFLSAEKAALIAGEFRKHNGVAPIRPVTSSVKSGVAVVPSLYTTLIKSGVYKTAVDSHKTPSDILSEYLARNKKHMRSKARRELQQLIEKSAGNWSRFPF